MFLNIKNAPANAFVQLLSKSDKPIDLAPVVNGRAEFLFIKPGEYYVRLIDDVNDNKKWDPGLYNEKKQPENVYYYPTKFNLKANWDVEEDWDIKSVNILEQKPTSIIKSPKNKK